VISGEDGRLIAFAQVPANGALNSSTWVYVSRDGGRHWRYTTREGAF
jgi:hypothetical protein